MLLLGLIMAGQASLSGCSHKKTKESMRDIEFIPKEFNDIKLGDDETEMVKTTPGFPNNDMKINAIAIHTPQQIICNFSDMCMMPVIPLCVRYAVSLRRALKYNQLSDRLIHVKSVDNGTEYSGKIVEKIEDNCIDYVSPGVLEAFDEAQQYADAELDNGQYESECMNINIMEYVDFPFLPGKYEVWLSFSGLESSHTVVEIVKRGNEK